MGRRFQAYYIFKNSHNETKKIGFHMQVCAGDDTIFLLEQVLDFTSKYMEYSDNYFSKPHYDFNNNVSKLMESISSIIYRTGVFLNARLLDEDITNNPLRADNDEGIFIVDLREKNPKYILMNYEFTKVTPSEYFEIYKNEYDSNEPIMSEIVKVIQNIESFDTISVEELAKIYISFNKNS